MNLHLSYVPYLKLGSLESRATREPPCLDPVDLDLGKTLSVTLLPLVLLTALLFKDDYLFGPAVAYDGSFDRTLADLGIAALAEDERRDLNLCSLVFADGRDA